MVQGRHTFLDYLFFLRPVLLPPVWTIALLGTVRLGLAHEMSAGLWILFFVHLAALFGGVYTLNQICDVESDRANHKLFFLPDSIISLPAAWRFTIALDAIALSISFVFGWLYLVLSVTIVALGILYSVGSYPWKNHAWLGLISNALGHGAIVYLFGYLITGCPLSESWPTVAAYTLAVCAVYLVTTVPDASGDRSTAKLTAAVQWGGRATLLTALAFVTSAIALSGMSSDWYLTVAALAAWPFFVLSVIRPSTATTAAKSAVAALSVAAAVAYPLYVGLLVVGFVGTRLFFRWRFGISYPTFV
jgi:4-hydroxybenzoate polyprenyltransferase